MHGFIFKWVILNEKQLRLYTNLESIKIKIGYRGDKVISEKLRINVKIADKDKKKLFTKNIDFSKMRNLRVSKSS
jgi:predicted nucleic acid-binding OB-fold protein